MMSTTYKIGHIQVSWTHIYTHRDRDTLKRKLDKESDDEWTERFVQAAFSAKPEG